jgi:peptidoglycan/LPS O-acetylase OafA/YrhL
MTPTNYFRSDINALRAIAIVSVVLFHYEIFGLAGGFAGVDVFFVISGFLITSHIARDLHQGRFSYQSFYVSRLRRIFPALAVMCIACAAWGWVSLAIPRDYLSNARHELYALLFVSNYAFSNERGYFDIASSSKPLLHTWSLSVEGQFYLFLPLFMTTVWRFGRKSITAITFLFFLGSLFWCLYYSQINAADSFYQLSTRTWEFLAGSLLALMPAIKTNAILSNIGSLLGLILLLAGVGLLDSSMVWPGYPTLLPVAGSVLLIIAGDVPATRWLFGSWVLQRLGDISYSLYLWHWPILVFGRQYATGRLERELSQHDIMALMLLALVMAVLSWKFVEKPIRLKTGWWTFKRTWQGALATLVCFIAFTVAAAITRGFPNRLPDYMQRGFLAVSAKAPRSDECFRDVTSKKQAPEQFCRFGAEGSAAGSPPSLILWGDSHANMYSNTVSEAAKASGQAGYIAAQSHCRATLPDQGNDLKGAEGLSCTRFNNEVNAFIDGNPSIHTIIIARMWGDADSLDRTIKLINYLVDNGKNVILVGPIPLAAFRVPEHWIARQIKAERAIDSMSLPLSSQQRLFDLQNIAKSRLSGHLASGRVVFIDPLKIFCNQIDCMLINGGVSYFMDDNHLSEAGAMLLNADFANALAADALFFANQKLNKSP